MGTVVGGHGRWGEQFEFFNHCLPPRKESRHLQNLLGHLKGSPDVNIYPSLGCGQLKGKQASG